MARVGELAETKIHPLAGGGGHRQPLVEAL
jgi:hypothetical protein